ncbi:hypothetical protein [Sandaracinus amylolyticus]|uniref:Uncharacterized protein n=1 Tax=Sandaracinus amylolyticus TaxID=927083 RepID=A0A0F6SDD1_9BACT|nr:hypothetical protein [Sandaracinus amylolyticus]AKF03234.1 hypothetical protein DB32_000383 [Sandaracinus amylolyticus]
MDDRLDEILDRLRELDHRLATLEGRRGHHEPRCHACGAPRGGHRGRHREHERRGGGDFDEKRVIDTIVRLVCENVAPIVEDVVARELDRRLSRREP